MDGMGPGGGGVDEFDLRTLHLLDVLAAYFPYSKIGVTEAVVSYLTAQHSVPSIDQYKEQLPKRSSFEFDLHVYNKVSRTPALLMVCAHTRACLRAIAQSMCANACLPEFSCLR